MSQSAQFARTPTHLTKASRTAALHNSMVEQFQDMGHPGAAIKVAVVAIGYMDELLDQHKATDIDAMLSQAGSPQ